jgi:hypothetical protein
MKRITLLFISVLFVGSILVGQNVAIAHEDNVETQKNVELTESQKKELETLYNGMFETHKQIVNKYVEFGVFSKEKGDKILSHMEERHTKLKENGFIPKWDRNKHHKMKNKENE